MSKSKKEKFNQKSSGGLNPIFIVAGIAIIAILAIAFMGNGDSNSPTAGSSSQPNSNVQIKEVNITPTVADNTLVIKKSEVEQNKIVRFEYEPVKVTLKNGSQIAFPLMAYVTPSGKLNVAIRMCEPCNGLTFSTMGGNILNCDTCGTQWDIETNEWNGVGAESCGTYAPEAIEYELNGDEIIINTDSFKNWVPRA